MPEPGVGLHLDDTVSALQDALRENYTFERAIGKGGMATVYLATEMSPPRQVAIKVMDPALSDRIGRERFLREVEIVSQLTHPHIVPIFRFGEAHGQLYYVMPYIRGHSLRARIAREGTLQLHDAVHVAHDVADALTYAHEAGIVHRDIKPENILLSGGHAVVTDFGIARALHAAANTGATLTMAGLPIGTPGYMSPEQAAGAKVDPRTDIYSLGIVLYEMLFGELPQNSPNFVSGATPTERRTPAGNGEFETIPDPVNAALQRALALNPVDRFPNTEELMEALGAPHGTHMYPGATAAPAVASTQPQQVPPKSIAVLPFANLSADPENEYFSDGITDDIITQLSKISDLKVTSRTSVMQYKNEDRRLQEIGRELGVATILEGSVRRAGNRVRIVSQLIDVQKDTHLWADTYDRDLTDIFAIQSDVASHIASALQAQLSPKTEASIKRKPTDDLEAYNAFLEGQYHWNKFSPEANARAFTLFEEAIARDPNFALAYAGLANAYFSVALGAGQGIETPADAFLYARQNAEKALSLDDGIADAYATLGSVQFWHDWDWKAAQRSFDRANELGCGCAEPNLKYGFFLAASGRHQDGIAYARRALELDPLSLIVNAHVAYQYYWDRDYTRASRQFAKTLDLDEHFLPARIGLGWTSFAEGKLDAALEHFDTAVLESGRTPHTVAALAIAHAASENRDLAMASAEELCAVKRSDDRYVSSRDVALVYHSLGEREKALEWLEKACDERAAWMVFLNVEPLWDDLRDDPRLQALIEKMGLR